MAYSTGDTILDDEYNTLATGNAAGSGDNGTANLNTLWGTGTGDYGYGETGSVISAVSAGGTITATQWETLVGRMETIAAHQGSSVTAVSTITAGDTITALANFQTDVNTIWANRLNATASGSAIGSTSSGTNVWTGEQNTTMTLTFASENAARYYFNAGGLVTFTFSRTGGTTNDKNTEWSDLCTNMGTITFSGSDSHSVAGTAYTGTTQTGGYAGGAGSAKSTIDYHALTGSYQQLIIKYADTSPYTGNYIKLEAFKSGAVITFKVRFVDDADDTGNPTYVLAGTDPASLDNVDGTLTVTVSAVQPDDTYLTSAAWGTPTWATTDTL